MNGLAPHTAEIIDAVSHLECIRPYLLAGGTALSLQIGHRQSEDLDFMRWRTYKSEKMEVDWANIRKELEQIAPIQNMNLMDINHVEFVVSGVKLSFYACPKRSPVKLPVHITGNIYAADITAIGAMKMEVMLRRSVYRDYYDIYAILQEGVPFNEMVALALDYSGHILHTKNLYAMLTNGRRFIADSRFKELCPKYSVTVDDIENYLRDVIGSRQ